MNLSTGYLGTALTHPDQIKNLASKILNNYDKEKKGHLGDQEVANIMIDLYRSFNQSCTPSKNEIENYANILDFNKDHSIGINDLESTIKKYLMVDL